MTRSTRFSRLVAVSMACSLLGASTGCLEAAREGATAAISSSTESALTAFIQAVVTGVTNLEASGDG